MPCGGNDSMQLRNQVAAHVVRSQYIRYRCARMMRVWENNAELRYKQSERNYALKKEDSIMQINGFFLEVRYLCYIPSWCLR